MNGYIEKYQNRLDYWLMVMTGAAEGSGTREIAKRMAEKYSELRDAALQREAEHEQEHDDCMGTEGGSGKAAAGSGH